MGSGGGGTQYVQSTTNTSNIPSYAQPYFEQALNQGAQTYLNTPYTTYQGQRIADFTGQQQTLQNNVAQMASPTQFNAATSMAQQAGTGALQTGQNYTPTQFSTGQFNNAAAAQYMSPYMQNAVDVQKNQAIRDAQIAQTGADLGAARQGTYGGSRELLAQTERERNLNTNLANIQATGEQQAYQNATSQFNADQARALQAQQLGAQSQQFGANLGLQGLSQAGQMAQTLGNLGYYQQNANIGLNQFQQQTAAQQQALNQQYLTQAYNDFLTQQNYPNYQLQQYSDLIHGLVGTGGSSQVTAAQPSLAQSIMGTGLGALGMSNLFSSGKTG